MAKEYLSVREVGALLDVSKNTVYEMLRHGLEYINPYEGSKKIIIFKEDLDRFLKERKNNCF